jgi:CheY-like chemotaxis protein
VSGEAAMPAAGRRCAVMVVDDDDDNREVLREVLGEQGYAVSCARDGAEALALLAGLRPDVILLDLNMPTMSGLEFRAAQVGDPSLRTIPTVVMTAVDRVHERMGEPAPEATLLKPIKLAQLLTILKRYAQVT